MRGIGLIAVLILVCLPLALWPSWVGLVISLFGVVVASAVVSPIVADAGRHDDLVHLPQRWGRRPSR